MSQIQGRPGNAITNTGNYLALISNTGNYLEMKSQIHGTAWHGCHRYREDLAMKSQIRGTTWHWCHKYWELPGNEIKCRELPDMDVTDTGKTWQCNHKYRELPDIDVTNTGNYLAMKSQIQGTTWHWCHKYWELSGNEITNTGNYLTLMSQILGTIWQWNHKYRELPDIDVTNTGSYLAMKSQIQGTTWHWCHKYRALPDIDITNRRHWNTKSALLYDFKLLPLTNSCVRGTKFMDYSSVRIVRTIITVEIRTVYSIESSAHVAWMNQRTHIFIFLRWHG